MERTIQKDIQKLIINFAGRKIFNLGRNSGICLKNNRRSYAHFPKNEFL